MVNYLAYPMAYIEEKRAIGNSFLNDVNKLLKLSHIPWIELEKSS